MALENDDHRRLAEAQSAFFLVSSGVMRFLEQIQDGRRLTCYARRCTHSLTVTRLLY